jgi:hypothetical protein
MVEERVFEPIGCDFRILLRELNVGVLNVGIECIVARLN